MNIYGLEKLSLVDYDGYVACTVFTGACNFRCPFCHNASLVVDYANIPPFPMDEFFDYVKKRKGVIEGVCVTGGEPTINSDLPSFIKDIKNLGVKVKLDTNGTNPDMVKLLWQEKLVDYFAMDIKNDKEHYGKIIDIENFDTSKVEKTVDFFLSNDVDFEFRTTLINEFHKEENIEKIGKWIFGTKKYFMQKFKNGENCLTQNLTEVPTQKAQEYLKIISKFVPNAKLRGYDL